MDICNKILGKAVGATSGGNQCFCGDTYPPENTRVEDEKCNVGCTGYDLEACKLRAHIQDYYQEYYRHANPSQVVVSSSGLYTTPA